MHFHPHKRGERKMTASEARRGGKPGDLDPPMEVLKANWLREVEEVVGDVNDESEGERAERYIVRQQAQGLAPQPPNTAKPNGKTPTTPTTPSTKSTMAIDSIVDKTDT
jgi:hypothetical protein